MEQAIADYVTTLHIPVSRKYFRKRVASHPDYPSLLSISDTLEYLGIPHGAARMDRAGLDKLECPYVLHLDKGAGEFILIKEDRDLAGQTDIPEDWNGIVLKAEAPEAIEDEENREYLAKEKADRFTFGLLILSVMVISAMSWVPGFSWAAILFLVTTIAGVALGYLLVAKDLGVKYEAVESFCNAGQKTNCDRVLQSDQATLFGYITFSDAVISYFTAQLIAAGLLIPLAVNATSLWWALAVVGILTLPVVAYSLWLQVVTFKTWCRLCLLVSAVLVIQAGLFWWMYTAGMFGLSDGAIWAAGMVAGLFLATGSCVFLIKIRLKDGKEAGEEALAANRIKYNPSVFIHQLLQQPQPDCTPIEQELMIGKADVPIKITMAASLGCGPCKDGFEKASQLVRMYPEQVNLTVRFSVPEQSNGSETDPGRYLLVVWLREIYGKNDSSKESEQLVRDWFEQAGINAFREKYPLQVNGQNKELESLAMQHSDWFKKADIKGTPTFFVNGYKLPGQYRVGDLRYLVAGFSEQIFAAGEKMNKAETEQKF